MYTLFQAASKLYHCLADPLSKELFLARLRYDLQPDEAGKRNLERFYSEQSRRYASGTITNLIDTKKEMLMSLRNRTEKIILYGTSGNSIALADKMREFGIGFFGFCGRRAQDFPDGILDKPVFSPEWLVEHQSEIYILVTVTNLHGSCDEILRYLQERSFPEERVLAPFEGVRGAENPQYFEFPDLFIPGTAFVDGGALDGRDSIRFAKACGGNYSKIYAFEPDPDSAKRCEYYLGKAALPRVEVVQAALSDSRGSVDFLASSDGDSGILRTYPDDRGKEKGSVLLIDSVTIDEVLGSEICGFIKLDIEGGELSALHGAMHTIVRDRPFMALCVYHKPGDVLAIMDYVHQLVPEYRFYLRQYAPAPGETVLYASVGIPGGG